MAATAVTRCRTSNRPMAAVKAAQEGHAVCNQIVSALGTAANIAGRCRRYGSGHIDAQCRDRCRLSSWRGSDARAEFEHQSPDPSRALANRRPMLPQALDIPVWDARVLVQRSSGGHAAPCGHDRESWGRPETPVNEREALASNSTKTRDVMKFGTAAALTVLLGCLAPPTEAQTSARIFVVMVDDLRFKPSETRTPSSCWPYFVTRF